MCVCVSYTADERGVRVRPDQPCATEAGRLLMVRGRLHRLSLRSAPRLDCSPARCLVVPASGSLGPRVTGGGGGTEIKELPV